MNRQTTVEQSARAAELYRKAGIEVAAFFIVGYPGETTAPAPRRDDEGVLRGEAAGRSAKRIPV